MWALLVGPYSRFFALVWEYNQDAKLVDIRQPSSAAWTLPGLKQLYPHDVALGAAALELTGAGDRLFALYVAPLCHGCGALRKFVLFPKAFNASGE